MKLYVQSAGYLQNFGYQWVTYENGETKAAQPPESIADLNLRDMDVVFSSSRRRLVIFCNNIPAQRRVDYNGQPINNRFVITGGLLEHHAMARVFCYVMMNQEAFYATMDAAVSSNVLNEECGFDVNFQAISQHIETASGQSAAANRHAPLRGCSYAKDNAANREMLALELLSSAPHNKRGVIAAVGGHAPLSRLEEKRVLRALLENVDNAESIMLPSDTENSREIERAVLAGAVATAVFAAVIVTAHLLSAMRGKCCGRHTPLLRK